MSKNLNNKELSRICFFGGYFFYELYVVRVVVPFKLAKKKNHDLHEFITVQSFSSDLLQIQYLYRVYLIVLLY